MMPDDIHVQSTSLTINSHTHVLVVGVIRATVALQSDSEDDAGAQWVEQKPAAAVSGLLTWPGMASSTAVCCVEVRSAR